MHFKKFPVVIAFFSLILASTNPVFGFMADPPVLQASADRDGDMVVITGSVTDENPETVVISVQIGSGPAILAPVFMNDGRFSFEIAVPLDVENIVITATNQDGLSDTQNVDVAFQPNSSSSK